VALRSTQDDGDAEVHSRSERTVRRAHDVPGTRRVKLAQVKAAERRRDLEIVASYPALPARPEIPETFQQAVIFRLYPTCGTAIGFPFLDRRRAMGLAPLRRTQREAVRRDQDLRLSFRTDEAPAGVEEGSGDRLAEGSAGDPSRRRVTPNVKPVENEALAVRPTRKGKGLRRNSARQSGNMEEP